MCENTLFEHPFVKKVANMYLLFTWNVKGFLQCISYYKCFNLYYRCILLYNIRILRNEFIMQYHMTWISRILLVVCINVFFQLCVLLWQDRSVSSSTSLMFDSNFTPNNITFFFFTEPSFLLANFQLQVPIFVPCHLVLALRDKKETQLHALLSVCEPNDSCAGTNQ